MGFFLVLNTVGPQRYLQLVLHDTINLGVVKKELYLPI